MRILDRYILANFLVPFLYSFFGFIAIWLVIDLSNNMNDFLAARISPALILYFYSTQAPQVIVLILPIALLLSLLYALSRMSRSNEIISMLTAGQGLYRITAPLVLVGLAAAGLSYAMNYKLAPHADFVRKSILDSVSRTQQKHVVTDSILYRNRRGYRTWYILQKIEFHTQFIHSANPDLHNLQGLHITQQDADGNILRKYYAAGASFNQATNVWTLYSGKTVNFNLDGDVTTQENWPSLVIKDWPETPWRIFSSDLDVANLSVPELRDYIQFNAEFSPHQIAPYLTHYYYRLAVPFACVVIIFIAAPLGIVYSRRGVLVGVASSIFIYFGMLFIDKLFLALGKHGSIPPFFAAWANNIFFLTLGLILLYMRSTNRDLSWWTPKHIMYLLKRS